MTIKAKGKLGSDFVDPQAGFSVLWYDEAGNRWCYKGNDGVEHCFQKEITLEEIQDLLNTTFTSPNGSISINYNDASDVYELEVVPTVGAYKECFVVGDWVLVGGIYNIEITHNLNSLNVVADVWENQTDKIIPERIEIVDLNKIKIYTLLDPDCRYNGCITVIADQN